MASVSMEKASQVAKLFEEALDYKLKDKAEQQLIKFVQEDPECEHILFAIMESQQFNNISKKCASIQLKNVLKKKFTLVMNEKPSDQYTKEVFEKLIPFAMCDDDSVQDQSCTSLALILETLEDSRDQSASVLGQFMKTLVSRAQQNINHNSIYSLLMTFKIFSEKYTTEMKSDELLIQLLTIQSSFCSPFKDIFLYIADQMSNLSNCGFQNATKLLKSMKLCCSIIKAISYYDVLEFFEDNLKIFFDKFIIILNLRLPNTDQLYNTLNEVKVEMMDCVNFFHQKYMDDIKETKVNFFEPVYNQLLENEGENHVYNLLCAKYFKFMMLVSYNAEVKDFLSKSGVIESVCTSIILPNIGLGTTDEYKFEEYPDEYINEDLILMESASRRKACENFLKEFSMIYEGQTVNLFLNQVQNGFSRYSENKQNWKECEKSLVILTSIACRGFTKKFGASSKPDSIDIVSLFQDVICNFIKDKSTNEFIVAKCLKFICIFRSLIPLELLFDAFPSILQLLLTKSQSILFYAGYTVDQLMTTLQQSIQSSQPSNFAPILATLPDALKHLLIKILSDNEDDQIFNSEILVKTAIHIFVVLGEKALESIASYFDEVVRMMVLKLKTLSEVPGKPMFMHRLYELLALLIRVSYSISPESISLFESYLFPMFQHFFTKNYEDSIPYALQLIALLLELQAGKENINDSYSSLASPLIQPQLWESTANIYPIVTLLRAIIYTIPKKLDSNFFSSVCLIAKRLMSSRSLESEAFSLINTVAILDKASFANLNTNKAKILKGFVELILLKIKTKKTQKNIASFALTLCLVAHIESVEFLKGILESIQQGLLMMVLQKLFIAGIEGVVSKNEMPIIISGSLQIFDFLSTNGNNIDLAKEIVLALAKLVGNIKLSQIKSGNESSAINNLYDESDSLDAAAAIGGLKFHKIFFGANWTPLKAFKKSNQEVQMELAKCVTNICSSQPDLKSAIHQVNPNFVEF